MKHFHFVIFLFLLSTDYTFGQRLMKAENFIINTPFLEPEERILSQRTGSEGIITIAKNKGTTKGASLYFLEHRKTDLSLKWSTPVRISDTENILHLKILDQQVVLFTVIHNERQKHTTLRADIYNKEDGQLITEKVLLEHDIDPWLASENKGAVVRNLDAYIISGSNKGYVTPLEYRYSLSFSPDSSLLLFYKYDFSEANLLAEGYVFDQSLTLVKNAVLPIDKGFINYGLSLSPEGNIYILNAKKDGTAAVIYYDLDQKSSRYLEISPSNTDRAHFSLMIEDEFHAILSYINLRGNLLGGLSYSRFNFQDNQIDWIHYQDLSKSLDSLASNYGETISRNNFELVHKTPAKDGYLFILEQREFLSPGQTYEPGIGDNKGFWKPGKGKVVAGNILLIFFDNENVFQWIRLIPKNQTAGSEEGLLSLSFNHKTFEENIQILYGIGIGSVSQLNHISIDWQGNIIKSELPNELNIILLRPYTQWLNNNEVIIVGKNGFGGKSSLILKYKIPSF